MITLQQLYLEDPTAGDTQEAELENEAEQENEARDKPSSCCRTGCEGYSSSL